MSNITTIESSGTTSLLTDGTYYYFQIGSGPAVELSYNGAPVTVGQFGAWTPIAVQQTATGYEVALEEVGTDQYGVWDTDSSGNFVSAPLSNVSGTSLELESMEASFNYDLNGNGVIGVPPSSSWTLIESSGTTSLLTDGTYYYLRTGSGPVVALSYDGAPVTVGQFGAWTLIAAQQTATGYEVALKEAGANLYGVWDTDTSGNYVSAPISNVSGTSAALESMETSFNYDLNGDGIIGVPSSSGGGTTGGTTGGSLTVIESSGTTSLLTDGTYYYLEPAGGSTVKLSYGGSPVVAGEFGAWTPIAAQQISTGYEVALEEVGSNLYGVWDTDSSGNYVSGPISNVSGTSAALESIETSFNYDLNGDGIIGVPPPTVIESNGSMSLLTDGTNYYLEPNGGTAVKLSYNGAPVTVGQFGGWTPAAATQTTTGYEVALKLSGSDEFTIWNTDSSGNYLSSAFNTALGSSAQLESYEPSFNYDLNSDGTIGFPASSLTAIESSGTTSLLTDGTDFFLEPEGGSPVILTYGGSPVTASTLSGWTPIAAQQTATGYEVALKLASSNQYLVWDTDSSGDYVSAPLGPVSGASAALESIETSFNYDLNGDGTIGIPPPRVIESSGSMNLVTDGTSYFLEPNGGTAVKLSYNGAPITVGEFGAWTPVAAQQTATGYEVALENIGTDQFGVWDTDSSGNYVSASLSNVSGTSAAFESMEVSFNDDLNGDGTIGVPVPSNATLIESSGTTRLLQVGNTYLIDPNGEGAVQLTYGGQPVTAGEFGGLTPIAAQQTATGFEVAWRTPGADVYQVWDTDSAGNYLSAPLDNVSGTSAALESMETSLNDDLNNDGVIGTPPASDQPLFAYQGTDANGAQVYDVTWNDQGNHPFAVRVLVPTDPSANYAHSFLYALPVENGLTGQSLGDGLDELESLNVENQYNTTIIEPIFPMYSWYADNPNDATIDYETFVADILPQWVDSHFSTTGDEQNLLIGFSKSGYGAVDLLLKHPTVFAAAAAFDFPADMTTYNALGSSTADEYGTQANFQNNYELDQSFVDTYKAPFTTQDRLWIAGGPLYSKDVADFNNLLTSQGVLDTFTTTQTGDTHSWTGGWVPSAVAGLFGLSQNLHGTV
jgi:serralysin